MKDDGLVNGSLGHVVDFVSVGQSNSRVRGSYTRSTCTGRLTMTPPCLGELRKRNQVRSRDSGQGELRGYRVRDS